MDNYYLFKPLVRVIFKIYSNHDDPNILLSESIDYILNHFKECKMKRKIILSVWGLALIAGCGSKSVPVVEVDDKAASPGPVIIETPDVDSNRVVVFTVVGKGAEPESALTKGQARLMAERAAVNDGHRQFIEKLRGVYVEAFSKAGYGVMDEDYINTCTRALIRGVQVHEVSHGQYGIVSAVMKLRVNFTKTDMVWWPEGLGKDIRHVGDSVKINSDE